MIEEALRNMEELELEEVRKLSKCVLAEVYSKVMRRYTEDLKKVGLENGRPIEQVQQRFDSPTEMTESGPATSRSRFTSNSVLTEDDFLEQTEKQCDGLFVPSYRRFARSSLGRNYEIDFGGNSRTGSAGEAARPDVEWMTSGTFTEILGREKLTEFVLAKWLNEANFEFDIIHVNRSSFPRFVRHKYSATFHSKRSLTIFFIIDVYHTMTRTVNVHFMLPPSKIAYPIDATNARIEKFVREINFNEPVEENEEKANMKDVKKAKGANVQKDKASGVKAKKNGIEMPRRRKL